MKNFTLILKSALLLIASFLISCSGDELKNSDLYQEEVPQKIADFINTDGKYSTFNNAIQGTEIQDWLQNQENITLFAPTDQAFEAYLSQNGLADISEIPTDELSNLIKNHIIETEIFLGDLESTDELFLETMASTQFESSSHIMSLVTNIDGLKINGVSVQTPDKLFVNGVVHSVDQIVNLSTAGTFINECSKFSKFRDLIESSNDAAMASTTLNEKYIAGSSQELTLFAPDNDAIDYFNANLVTTNSTSSSNQVLNYAVRSQISSSNNLEINELTDGLIIPTLAATITTTVDSDNQVSFRTSLFGEVVRLSTDELNVIQTSNGILLLTDKVLY